MGTMPNNANQLAVVKFYGWATATDSSSSPSAGPATWRAYFRAGGVLQLMVLPDTYTSNVPTTLKWAVVSNSLPIGGSPTDSLVRLEPFVEGSPADENCLGTEGGC